MSLKTVNSMKTDTKNSSENDLVNKLDPFNQALKGSPAKNHEDSKALESPKTFI